jgi:hypothetical protein
VSRRAASGARGALGALVALRGPARRAIDTLRTAAPHVDGPPDVQTTLDVFRGEWASRLPPPYDLLRAGEVNLFDDDRIRWSFEHVGPLTDQTVLELGPLEGGHTYMALQAGAARVVAVEGNTRHFLKCLVVKELLQMDGAEFRLGDFVAMMQTTEETYDLVLAQGVLYHMVDPVELIALAAERGRRLALWTQYYDRGRIARLSPIVRRRFAGAPVSALTRGFEHTHHRHDYGLGRKLVGFYGGNQPHSNWLSREDLMRALQHFGWRVIEVGFDNPDHPHGPCLALTAVRD